MSLGPLDKPAELQSALPVQVLCAVTGFFVVLLQGALAHWSVFYSAVPLLTLGYIFFMQIAYPSRLPLLSVLCMGLFSEVMFFQMLGLNSTVFMIVALVTQWRSSHLHDADFIELWANFSLIVMLAGGIKLVIYFVSYFSFPDLSFVFQQTGITVLLFPIFYVILIILSSVLQRLTSFRFG